MIKFIAELKLLASKDMDARHDILIHFEGAEFFSDIPPDVNNLPEIKVEMFFKNIDSEKAKILLNNKRFMFSIIDAM